MGRHVTEDGGGLRMSSSSVLPFPCIIGPIFLKADPRSLAERVRGNSFFLFPTLAVGLLDFTVDVVLANW